MNQAVVEDDVQCRLDNFFSSPLSSLGSELPLAAFDWDDPKEFISLRARTNKRRQVEKKRKGKRRKRKDCQIAHVEQGVYPHRPMPMMENLDEFYIADHEELPRATSEACADIVNSKRVAYR